jgi:ribosomal protein S18 acetylase RimI-like enzyme
MTEPHVTDDVEEFAAAAGAYLSSDPVAHTVVLTVLVQLRAGHPFGDSPRFAWLTDDVGDVVAAASWTPPFHVLLATADPESAATLAPAFPDTDGVSGRVAAAHAFAAALSRPTEIQRSDLQYRLDQIVAPHPSPGTPRRIAGEADLAVATTWFEAFVAEVGIPGGDHRGAIEYRMNNGGAVWFWERDGEPVCLVGRHPIVSGVSRIGPVYTPPQHRRRGYAAALTAAASRHALDDGAIAVTLFTDAANTTSNEVYRRIGFREVGTAVNLRFGPRAAGSGSGR